MSQKKDPNAVYFYLILFSALSLLAGAFVSFSNIPSPEFINQTLTKIDSLLTLNARFLVLCFSVILFIYSYALKIRNTSILDFDISLFLKKLYKNNKLNLQSFFIAFPIILIIYGSKLAFTSYAPDDYSIMNSCYSTSSIGWLGRWALPFFNSIFYNGWSAINPYFNTLTSLFAISLTAFISLYIWEVRSRLLGSIIIIICSASIFFASNLVYNLNTSVHLTFILAPLAILLLKRNVKLFPISALMLMFSIGVYQTNLQIAASIVVVWYIIALFESKISTKEINKKALVFMGVIILSYILSSLANNILLNIYDLQPSGRIADSQAYQLKDILRNALDIRNFLPYTGVHHINIQHNLLLLAITLIGSLSFLHKLKDQAQRGIKLILFGLVLLGSLYLIKLPALYGMDISVRALVHVSWFISLFIVLAYYSQLKSLKTLSVITSIVLILYSASAISAYYDDATKRATSDIIKVKEIVNNIRQHKQFTFSSKKVVKFWIVGEEILDPQLPRSTDAFAYSWSKYKIFENFSDFQFTDINQQEQDLITDKLKLEEINNYPNKGAIHIIDDVVVLILDKSLIE